MSTTYVEISNTEADRHQSFVAQQLAGQPWQFNNDTPFDLLLYYRPLQTDAAQMPNSAFAGALLGEVSKHKSKIFLKDSLGRTLKAGGTIEADPAVLLDKHVLDPKFKVLRMGSVVYDIGGPGENFHNLYADIPGVHVVNHFPFVVDVHYKGNLAAKVAPYDGLRYLGGSAATIYFNNSGDGLNFLDVIEFYQQDGPFLYKVALNDTHVQNIHIGVVSPQ